MAFTVNGVGTSFCFARGSGGKGGDALECFVIAYMPMLPLRAMHLFNETGVFKQKYQVVPLKLTWSLIFRVYLRYWLVMPLLVGIVLASIATWEWFKRGKIDTTLLAVGWTMTITCLAAYFLLRVSDKRNRRIRHVLGVHDFGRSDPATWDRSILKGMRKPQELFDCESYLAAVPVLLEKHDYQNAMWAARLGAALESRDDAENRTDEIIRMHQYRGTHS